MIASKLGFFPNEMLLRNFCSVVEIKSEKTLGKVLNIMKFFADIFLEAKSIYLKFSEIAKVEVEGMVIVN